MWLKDEIEDSAPSETLRGALHEMIDEICNELVSEWDDIQEAIRKACNKYPDLRDGIFKDYV